MAEPVRLEVLRAEVPAATAMPLSEWRCGQCRALLAYEGATKGSVLRVRCRRCRTWHTLTVR